MVRIVEHDEKFELIHCWTWTCSFLYVWKWTNLVRSTL